MGENLNIFFSKHLQKKLYINAKLFKKNVILTLEDIFWCYMQWSVLQVEG